MFVLNKSFFAFFASFFITFVIGFFAWDAFINSGYVSSEFFTASVLQDSEIKNIPAPDLAENEQPEQSPEPEVILTDFVFPAKDRQDQLDDIAEKLDILSRQVQELIQQQSLSEQVPDLTEEPKLTGEPKLDDKKSEDIVQNNNQNNNIVVGVRSGSGGGEAIIYPKILISEVQPADEQEFVELYNLNNFEVDLTGWYLQRKTAGSSDWQSFASKTLFSGKKITANGYFLIARTGYFINSSHIFVDTAITKDNSFALKNPNGDISDKLGFGNAKDPESVATNNSEAGQSIGRKVLADNAEQDTDNNFDDFELQTPTPNSVNITYVEPPLPPPVEPVEPIELKDTKAPEVSFTLDAMQTNPNFDISFTITDISDVVSPSGVGNYIFRWQEVGGDWQEDAAVNIGGGPTSADFMRSFSGEDGKTYNFQIQATDTESNISNWLPEIPATSQVNVPKKILINEIQIGGEAAKDEFIELYNPNSVDVDMSGFALKKKVFSEIHPDGAESNLVSSANFSGTIAAHGYFLIVPHQNEDGSEKYTGSKIPNLHYSGRDYSITPNNVVLLYNNNATPVLLDKVGYGLASDFETAPAINPDNSKSIKRKLDPITNEPQDTDDNSADFAIFETPVLSDDPPQP